jgi:hypothetical protein
MILDGHLSVADLDSEDVRYMRTLTAKYESMDLADASLVAYRTRSRQAFTNHFPERT